MAKTKPTLNVAFVGHVDHGKSTTIGRLMFDSGKVSVAEMEKLKAFKIPVISVLSYNVDF